MSVKKLPDIVGEVSKKIGFRRLDIDPIVRLVFKVMLDELKQGNDVMIKGFGRFTLSKRPPRMCFDAKNGQYTTSSFKASIKFKPSERLCDELAVLLNPELDWGEDDGNNVE